MRGRISARPTQTGYPANGLFKFAEQLALFDAVKEAIANLESVSKRASAEYARIQSAKSEGERKGAGRVYNQIQMEHDEAMQVFLTATNALRKSWERKTAETPGQPPAVAD